MRIITMFLLVSLVSTSCNRKAKLAKKCAELFPVEETVTVIEKTVIDTFHIDDSYIEYIDTTECLPSTDTVEVVKTVKKKVEGKTIYFERLVRDTIIVKENKAMTALLNYRLDSLQKVKQKLEIKMERKKGENRTLWRTTTGLGIAAIFGWLLFLRRK